MPPSDTEDYTARTFPVFPGDNPRERLLESLREELLGPSSEEEQLDISPKVRYLVGMLSPGGSTIEGIEDEQNLAQGEGEGNGDAQINLGISLEASSIGLSVVIDDEVNEVNISATWGEYFQVSRDSDQEEAAAGVQDTSEELSDLAKAREVAASQITPEESVDDLSGSATKGRFEKVWQRLPKELNFNLVLDDDTTEGGYAENGIGIRYLIKPLTGARVVSIFLVNERLLEPGQKPSVQEMIFQSKLHINGNNHPFLPRHNSITQLDPDPDIQSAELIYRKRHEFGVGHGVAANWISETEGRALSVWTDILPSFEVSKVTPRESEILDMDSLGIETLPEVTDRLQTFLNEYGQWLDVQEREAETIEGPLRGVADAHVQLGRNSLERMESGVSILQNESAFSAFQFANQAMALQRRRSVQVLQKQQGKEVQPDAEIAARWRPFQMGFVLQNLQGLVDRTHDDRQIADLLWFPTGGGKTEAYLGLTAFIFAFRRLEPIDGFTPNEGTAVIMRYTLRLLTIQQFQRALTLTASCEFLRTQNLELWGEERFTIGLWVGQSVTPNSYKDAKNALSKLKNGEQVYEKSPYQVLFCPWCGEDLAPQNYVTDDESERVLIHCWNPGCYLETSTTPSGIPALLVDQEIYRHPPSLLLATVDKFAQMAHNGRVQTLFGRVECHCPRHGWLSQAENHPSRHAAGIDGQEVIVTKAQTLLAPPELIIQDELHLISGPLGTLVGIYETAVDSLCAYKLGDTPIYPKVIASTATVRRAERQVRNLFDREVSVFPPQGLNSSDSFFAQESETDPGRLYVGVFGPGKSIKTTLVRTYASLLGRAKVEHDANPTTETDAYMTLVGYFNSLRELGGAVRLVEDDVPSRLWNLQRREFAPSRILYEKPELTSRRSSSEIGKTLKKLNRTHLELVKGAYPVDVLLASNMISVGVDIDRLGLMVVAGQPKTTAEYIQATSRVGRAFPGLVVQVYNWSRPRDISHYERFRHYHATFYRHVEATSVTPFSERARDRALPGVLVSHTRMSEQRYGPEKGADEFDDDDPEVREFQEFIIARSRNVAAHGAEVAEETGQQMNNLLFEWARLAADDIALVYSSRGQTKDKTKAVLMRPMEMEQSKGQWPVANSLREVEAEIDVVLKNYGGGTT